MIGTVTYMRVVTTCHKEGFERYGHRVLDGWKHWPRNAELYFYTEGYTIPETPGVKAIDLNKVPSLAQFKERYADYVAPNYLFDVVRFSHKVYAAADAFSDYKGLGVWMDADCVTYRDIPEGFIEGLLPKGAYIGHFRRAGLYTETGFWIVDCSHEQHEAFMQAWLGWYENHTFKALANWTDCETLDATIRQFIKNKLIQAHSLSGEFEKDPHPMAKVELAQYIDHCKGPRKEAGASPENAFRGAA